MKSLSWHSLCASIGAALLISTSPGDCWSQSLFEEQSFKPLTADNKALRVGDVVTIQVVENAMATANADTGTQRHNGVSADVAIDYHRNRTASVGLNAGSDFDGGGSTARNGRLVALLTVSVRDVLPNGDLLVAGEQQLTINDERQRIGVTGRVRPQDISDANVVLSTRVADADITYVGEGHLADRQKPAWWRKLLDTLGF